MTDREIVKALEWYVSKFKTVGFVYMDADGTHLIGTQDVLDLINRLQAENERLKEDVSKARRKALLEAFSKFAGHSDYHGDTILCKLKCMAEGKEVGNAKPLNKSEIKAEAYKECIEKATNKILPMLTTATLEEKETICFCLNALNNLLKELVGDGGCDTCQSLACDGCELYEEAVGDNNA